MALTPSKISAALRAVAPDLSETMHRMWLGLLVDHLAAYGLTTPRAIAAYLANVAHETGGFKCLTENTNYSAEGLLATFASRVTAAQALKLARRPKDIANHVYANRLGNGGPDSGDGWRYRGRGLIQITGRSNYAAVATGLGINCTASPELLEQPVYALVSSLWWWRSKGLTSTAEAGRFDSVCRTINGGSNGLQDRVARYNLALSALSEE